MPPAARVGDMHTCPDAGGPILPECSPNVSINGIPAARVGDQLEDSPWPPDTIAEGCPTVRINGIFAARVTDATARGGTIVEGSPNVSIG